MLCLLEFPDSIIPIRFYFICDAISPSSVFFSSVVVFFNSVASVLTFLYFSVFFVEVFTNVFIHALPSSVSIFLTISLSSLSGRFISFSLRSLFLGIGLVWFGIYSSVSSFCQSLCLSVCNRPNGYVCPSVWKEWSCVGAVPCAPEGNSPLSTRAGHSVGVLCVGCLATSHDRAMAAKREGGAWGTCLAWLALTSGCGRWDWSAHPSQMWLSLCMEWAGLGVLAWPCCSRGVVRDGWNEGLSPGPVIAWDGKSIPSGASRHVAGTKNGTPWFYCSKLG